MTQQLHSWVFNLKRNGNLRSCKNLCSNIQGSCIPNNPKLITTQMSFNGRMVKQTMLHAVEYYSAVWEKKKTTDMHNNLDEWLNLLRIMLSERSKSQKVTYYMISNYITFLIWENYRNGQRLVVARGKGQGSKGADVSKMALSFQVLYIQHS